jgi:hypothetical protein
MKSLTDIMNKLYKKSKCRVTLFVKEDDFLQPFMSIPLVDMQQKKSLRHLDMPHDKYFNLTKSKSLVCKSWNSQQPMWNTDDNIQYLYSDQKNHLKSIICVPIILENYGIICSICIDSHINIFTNATHEKDIEIISYLGNLIALELIKGEYFGEEGVEQ